MSINSRIYEVRKALNLTQTELGQALGLSVASISDMEHGNVPVSERTILAICSKFNISQNYLRNGIGDMFVSLDRKKEEFFATFKDLHPALQDFLVQTAKNLLDAQGKIK